MPASQRKAHCANCPVKYNRSARMQCFFNKRCTAHVRAQRKKDQQDQKDDAKEGHHEQSELVRVDSAASDSTASGGGVAGSSKGSRCGRIGGRTCARSSIPPLSVSRDKHDFPDELHGSVGQSPSRRGSPCRLGRCPPVEPRLLFVSFSSSKRPPSTSIRITKEHYKQNISLSVFCYVMHI